MIRYIRYAGLFVLAGELMVWVSPDLFAKWNLKGGIGLRFVIFLDINLLAIQINTKKIGMSTIMAMIHPNLLLECDFFLNSFLFLPFYFDSLIGW